MAKYIPISDLAKLTEGTMSAAGIKKAAQTGRIPAKKDGKAWLVDADSETARTWIAKTKAAEEPDDVTSLKAEIARLNRKMENLAKRTRQAEASERRIKKRMERMQAQHAAQTQENLDRIYQLSEQVATTASQQTETMARALVRAMAEVKPQIMDANTSEHE